MNKKVLIGIIVVVIIAIIGIVFIKSNKTMTKEQMLELAIDYSGTDEKNANRTNKFFIELSHNMANAETQKGKIYKIDGIVNKIEKDYCEFDYGLVVVRIYLPSEVLANFTKGTTKICVVGELTNIIKEQTTIAGYNSDETIFVFGNSYFLEEVQY